MIYYTSARDLPLRAGLLPTGSAAEGFVARPCAATVSNATAAPGQGE